MAFYTTTQLFDLSKTLARPLLEQSLYPWEALPTLCDFIVSLGQTLPKDQYEEKLEQVWVAKDATIAPSAYIAGPCIIDSGADIRHCAFIRGSAIIGKKAVVGNSTELKNVILFDEVQVPHFNYVGDSILGHGAHLGAGAITSNVRSDKRPVAVKNGQEALDTGLKKLGAMVGDFVEAGCNSVLCPGCVIGPQAIIYPTSCVRGTIPPKSIVKANGAIVPQK